MAQHGVNTWQQVHDGLRSFIAKRVSNEADVEDILQDVFLRMHRQLDGLRDPRRVVSWLFQITRHAIADHYRALARKREIPAGLAADLDSALPSSAPDTSPADSARLRAELAGCLIPMVERLSDQYRDAITLVELEGLTQTVAAKRLGLSVSGMKSRVQRGRQQLKKMLEDCCAIQLDARRSVADYSLRNPRSDSCGC